MVLGINLCGASVKQEGTPTPTQFCNQDTLVSPARVKPVPPAVEGGVLTTGPLAKSLYLMSLLYPVRNSD